MFPTFGLGEVDLLKLPRVTDPQTAYEYSVEPGPGVFDIVLTAAQEKKDLSQFFERDANFFWFGLHGNQTGAYSIQITLPNGRLFSAAPINNANLIGTADSPVLIWPGQMVPAGGKLGLVVKDLSGAGNTIQIVFDGVRLYRVK